MANKAVDLFVVGGGINGAAIARDAAGRGLSVMLAEKGDYACATSSASSKLIHGGLRYLETYEFSLVRHSLAERESLLKAAPYLVEPLKFLVPLRTDQKRPAWFVHLGLKLYDVLAGSKSLAASGRLRRADIDALPRLRKDQLKAVLHYHDCQTDDARLVLAVLIDARERGADIANRRQVTAIRARDNGYTVSLSEAGGKADVDARFVVNAAGPWANRVAELCDAPAEIRKLRLVRGSHIVLPMPEPAQEDAFTLQNADGRVVFTLPWLEKKFLVIGTTDAPHDGDPSAAACSAEERDYLLQAYNRYFNHPGGAAGPDDIVWTWSGVRPLVDDGSGDPAKVTRDSELTWRTQGKGGFVTVYGGKLTTHRDLAETVMEALARMGASMGGAWTRGALLPGGQFAHRELDTHARQGPEVLDLEIRLRWARTYGDRMMTLFDQIARHPEQAREIVAGVPEAELIFARESEDVATAEDFLYRRTKLFLSLPQSSQQTLKDWFHR